MLPRIACPSISLILRRYFTVEGSELRIGVYESSNTLCMYLESDTGGSTLDNNLWVKFRIAVLNQRHPERSEWKESAICTKTWNNSVLQFSKVNSVAVLRSRTLMRLPAAAPLQSNSAWLHKFALPGLLSCLTLCTVAGGHAGVRLSKL